MIRNAITSSEIIAKAIEYWASDWNLFCRDVLGARLDNEQQDIISSVQYNPLTAVASGTSRGKDYVAACASICFMYLTPRFDEKGIMVENTKVAMTAPSGRQVTNIMTPEVRRLIRTARRKFPFACPGRLVSDDIRTDYDEWFLTGFKADDNNMEAWSGFHAANTMFVVTEASGISETIFNAIEGNLQGNSRLLIVFNPNVTTGYAARAMKSNRFAKFRLDSLNAENVVTKKQAIPGQVNYEWVKDKVENWCTPIKEEEYEEAEGDFKFEGGLYRPNDLFRVKVRGMFPKVSEDVLIPLEWIEAAQERWKSFHPSTRDYGKIGVDVAGMGRDCSVFCYRYGNYVSHFDKHNSGGKADHMKIAGKVKHDVTSDNHVVAYIDTIGEGAGVYSRCEEQGLGNRVISCKYSEAAKINNKPLRDITGQIEFGNMRAYLFWAVRDWLDPKNNTGAMLPSGGTLAEEATEIKWFFRSDGKIMIEKKEDIKERLGHSTDEFDALANTFYPKSGIFTVSNEELDAIEEDLEY